LENEKQAAAKQKEEAALVSEELIEHTFAAGKAGCYNQPD
jgi:hypothetical protein